MDDYRWKRGDVAVANRDIDTEAGWIRQGDRIPVENVSAAGHFLRLRGHSTYLRRANFTPLAVPERG